MKYVYSGPVSGVTVRQGETAREVPLFPGATVDLPSDAEFVGTMLACGLLTPAPPAATASRKGTA